MWSTIVRVEVGDYVFVEDLRHLVNDLLMGLFFFVVGMEIKRELVNGELRDRRAVALPAMAALGGMVVPALIFLAINAGGDGRDGWGIPMATDVAFALGVVALLGQPCAGLDQGAAADAGDRRRHRGNRRHRRVLLVGRRSRSSSSSPPGSPSLVAVLHNLDVTYPLIPLGLGLVMWLMVYESGVHATHRRCRDGSADSGHGLARPTSRPTTSSTSWPTAPTSTPPTSAMAAWAIRGLDLRL